MQKGTADCARPPPDRSKAAPPTGGYHALPQKTPCALIRGVIMRKMVVPHLVVIVSPRATRSRMFFLLLGQHFSRSEILLN